jgi:hypothetical protein
LARQREALGHSAIGAAAAMTPSGALADGARVIAGAGASGARGLWGSWVPWACVPAAAIVSGLAVWMWISSSRPAELRDVDPVALPIANSPVPIAAPEPVNEPAPSKPAPHEATAVAAPLPPAALDRRWIPDDSQAVLSLRLAHVYEQPAARAVLLRAAPLWARVVAPLYMTFELSPKQIRRVTWSTTELQDSQNRLVVVIELDQPLAHANTWLARCERLSEKLGETPCYRLSTHGWSHPFALVDSRTIVSGPIEILASLAALDAARPKNVALQRTLDLLDANSAALLAIDLAPLRSRNPLAIGSPPELWGVNRADWQLVIDMPSVMGLQLDLDTTLRTELALTCESKTVAEKVHAALDQVLASLEKTLAGETAALKTNLLALPMTTATADQVDLLLSSGRTALAARESCVDDTTVLAKTHWQGDLASVSVAAMTSIPALEASRLASARVLDEENHRELLRGLDGCQAKEQFYPAGAGGAALLPPETRLSWLASVLPYYGQFEWHRKLNFARPWNDAANRDISTRPLEAAINPAQGLSFTSAGFPVTHYVGPAGVGSDAAQLDAKDPRAGVFGYSRRVSREAITDGTSNTIALMGVSGNLGPWASGGTATVRALTRQPYVNGPDGFGSGQPGGMLVGMADGSVRFIAKDIDPRVLEALATIHGGESVTLADQPLPGPPPKSQPARIERPEAKQSAQAEPEPPARPADKIPQVDVQARLNDKLPGIEFRDVPLADFVALVSQLTTLPITLDADAMLDIGVHADAKLTVAKSDATVGEIIETALAPHMLTMLDVQNQVLVTTFERGQQELRPLTHDVSDFGREEQADLAALVCEFVDSSSWTVSGGQGSIRVEEGSLAIKQTPSTARRVLLLLDKVRLARGKSPRDPRSAESLDLRTRYAQAKQRLAKPVTANFRDPAPLAAILNHLQQPSGARILLDGLGLASAGRWSDSEASVVASEQPLDEALKDLLRPLGLAYRIIDERTLLVTSRREAESRLDLELYPVGDLLTGEQTSARLIERLRKELPGRTWNDVGGAGALHFDVPSSHLLVLQNQAAQRRIELLLATWREEAAQARTGSR